MVKDVQVEVGKKDVNIRLVTSAPADVETWAVAEKADLFRKVFRRELHITVAEAALKPEAPRARKRA